MALACASVAALPAHAQEQTASTVQALPEVSVTADRAAQAPTEGSDTYTIKQSSSATNLPLSPRETPQSISVVTRAKMDDFQLNTINDVLASTTGVTVEKVETDRTYYTARGFDVTNFMFDGVGIPMTFGVQYGDMDMAMYDRVEIVRGANGLTSSTGNPSATVNFIRKRPTKDFQASASVKLGSWDTRRVDADLSGPINAAGTLTARVVASHQEGNSYLDRYRPTRDVFYGVIEAELGNDTLLTAGYSYQKVHGKGAMWGALPLTYTDGSATNYGVGTSTSADWSYLDSTQERSFAELQKAVGDGWQWKTTVGYNEIRSDAALLYVYGTPDKATGTGLYSYPSLYDSANKQSYVDSNLTGKYTLFGREHDANVGINISDSKLYDISHYGQGLNSAISTSQAFDGSYVEPTFDYLIDGSSYDDRRKTIYGATRLNLSDRLKWLIGANYTQADSTGQAYGVAHQLSQSALSPYTGVVFDLTQHISAYGSYTRIFNPQSSTDASGAVLAAAKGKAYEVGLKGEFFQRRLNTSLALFRVEQSNIAEQAGTIGATAYYRGINAKSEGIEYDLSGELAKNWQASAGLVVQRITGDDGSSVRLYVPRHQLRLSTTYRLPQMEQVKVGASLNYQSKTSYDSTNAAYQGGYSVVNLMASYDISKNLSVSANLNNLFNKKYLTSVYWSQSYYAAPVNGSISVNWRY